MLSLGSRIYNAPRLELGYIRFPAIQAKKCAIPDTVEQGSGFTTWQQCTKCALHRPLEKKSAMCLKCTKKYDVDMPLKPGCYIRVKQTAKMEALESHGCAVVGPIIAKVPYFTTKSSAASSVISLVKRQLILTYPPEARAWREITTLSREYFNVMCPGFKRGRNIPTGEEWLQHTNMSSGNKKKCRIELERMRCAPNAKERIKKNCRIDLFPKRDKYDKSGLFEHDKSFYNRAISGFPAKATVMTGPVTTAMQEEFHRVWDQHHSICFAAGRSSEELAEFITSTDPTWKKLENDFSFFDSSIGVPAQKFLMSLYKYTGITQHEPDYMKYKAAQSLKTSGRSMTGVTFKVQGTMKSGACDTCLGNSLVNVYSHVYVLSKINNITIPQLMRKMRMVILGDDNLTFLHPSISSEGLEEGLIRLGFCSKLKIKKDLNELVFLNQRLYPSNHGPQLAPLPGRIISRLGWTVKNPKCPPAYFNAICYSFLSTCHHVPILREYFERMYFLTSRQQNGINYHRTYDVSDEMLYKNFKTNTSEMVPDSDEQFCKLYDINKQELEQLRVYIQGISTLTEVLDHPVLDKLVKVDMP